MEQETQKQSKPKLLLIMYRAFGDAIYASALLPYLFEKYDVYLECNTKVWLLFHDDPRFKQIARYTEYEGRPRSEYAALFAERWKKCRELIKPDAELNLNGTLEVSCIAENFQPEFYLPVGERRQRFGMHGFITETFLWAGIPVPQNLNLEGMYFWPDELQHVQAWKEKHKDQFVVILIIAGTTAQKVVHNYREITDAILEKYPDAVVYLGGDEACSALVPEHPRIKNMCGDRVSIKQAVLMTKYADMVIGPETFMLAAAGMWGTPKILFATTSSVYQMTQYQKNDFSIQAPIACSPCHRAIYFEDDCETPIRDEAGNFRGTACSKMFRLEDIMNRVEHVYRLKKVGSNGLGGGILQSELQGQVPGTGSDPVRESDLSHTLGADPQIS